ncbi:MAG: tagaturonate reductase [Gemmatimonadaceae bacterium]|nr:tagaturonate reductase [Gemmatimonadaceae bacterium]
MNASVLPTLGWDVLPALPDAAQVIVPAASVRDLPERAIQFGTGAFLRGFVDYFLDVANAAGQFNGRVVAVGSTGSGRDRAFGEQDGLYTLVSRGLENGALIEERRIVGAVSRALSAQDEWADVLACARSPHLSLVFSNTTEVGFTLDEGDALDAAPPRSFPGKLTRFLLERARTFAFAPSKGLIVLPCELLEQNGAQLRRLVLQVAELWECEPGFARWVQESVTFCDTLVDRIVPGAPRGEDAAQLQRTLGYQDSLLTTAECFRLFVIAGDDVLKARLGFADADAGIVVTPDIAAYRTRKVSLLNGAHTVSVATALLTGCDTVLQAMQHPAVGTYLQRVLLDEILPVVDAPNADAFARSVLERFANPHVQHALIDITLHGTTKWRVRVVPTLVRAVERTGRVPDGIAFGLAAHLVFARGEIAAARKSAGLSVPADELGDVIRAAWQGVDDRSTTSLQSFVKRVLEDTSLWGVDLSVLPQLQHTVVTHVSRICSQGALRALDALLSVGVA